MIIHQCDRCDKRREVQIKGKQSHTPTGWISIATRGGYGHNTEYELCPACAKALKLPDDPQDRNKAIDARLLEILEEIAQTAVEECPGCNR